jgi:triacylglycerol lipase
VFGQIKDYWETLQSLTPPAPWHQPKVWKGDQSRKVVCLHGLWRSRYSMNPLARFLHASCGAEVISLPYASVLLDFELAVDQLCASMKELGIQGELNFVTHSLGGILLRGLIARKEKDWTINKMVMLAPPHRGGQILDFLEESPVRFIFGKPSEYLRTGRIKDVVPELPANENMAVIMGNRSLLRIFKSILDEHNDGIVSVDDGYYANLGMYQVLPVDHTFILTDKRVMKTVGDFLFPD